MSLAEHQTIAKSAGKSISPMLSQVLIRAGLTVFFVFPYGLVGNLYTAVFLNFTVIFLSFILFYSHGFPKLSGMSFFGLIVMISSIISMSTGAQGGVIFSQANHFWQYLIALPFIVGALHTVGGVRTFLASRVVLTLLILSTIITFTANWVTIGYVHEFTPNSLFLVVALLYAFPLRAWNVCLAISVILIFLTAGRASPMLTGLILVGMRVFPLPSNLTKMIAIVLIVFPIVFYLTIEPSTLFSLLGIDHNAYIRAEFVRSAYEMLKNDLIFGVGFGPGYRPLNFNYLTQHTLLTDTVALQTVSNHHSIFDVALRVGVPAAVYFVVVLFISPKTKGNNLANAMLLVLALGVSANAWFENQAQLLNVILISAVLISAKNERPT